MGLGFGLQVQGAAQKQVLSIKVTPTVNGTSFTSVPANTAGIVSTDINQTVTVTLTVPSGWSLSDWQLDGTSKGTANPITVTMGSNHLLVAVLALVSSNASVAYAGTSGVVASLGNTTITTAVSKAGAGDVSTTISPSTSNSVSTGGNVSNVLTGGSTGANPNAKGIITSFTTAGSGADPFGWAESAAVLRSEEDSWRLTW